MYKYVFRRVFLAVPAIRYLSSQVRARVGEP